MTTLTLNSTSASAASSATHTRRQNLFAQGKPEIGLLLALTVPTVAATSSIKELTFGGINYQLVLTLGTPLVMFFVVLVKAGLSPVRLRTWSGHQLWLAWIALIWCSLVWGIKDSGAIKHAFEMSTPYLFALAGAMFVRDHRQLQLLFVAMLVGLMASMACVGAWKVGLIDAGDFSSGIALDPRPHSMSLLPIAALGMALVARNWMFGIAVWAVCLLISGIEGSRGVALCLLVLPLFHPIIRGLHWRVSIAVVVLLMGLAVFYLPPMQERLFPDSGSGTIADLLQSKQSGMGRFEAWPQVYERVWDAPVLGHGVSSVFHYVPTIWDRMRSPHNEFLCVSYEFGMVGLCLYVTVMIGQMWIVRSTLLQSQGNVRIALTTVYLSLIAFNIMACTDNPLSSNVRFLNPVFLLMGATLAIATSSRRGDDSTGDEPTSDHDEESSSLFSMQNQVPGTEQLSNQVAAQDTPPTSSPEPKTE